MGTHLKMDDIIIIIETSGEKSRWAPKLYPVLTEGRGPEDQIGLASRGENE
jgi:hypothetical protein